MLSASVRREVFEPAVFEQMFCLLGGNCEALTLAKRHTEERSSSGHQAGKGGSMILGTEFCIGGWNYLLGNYTVAEITACC